MWFTLRGTNNTFVFFIEGRDVERETEDIGLSSVIETMNITSFAVLIAVIMFHP